MGAETDHARRVAFERLFDAHHRAVRGYVLRRAPHASVEDAVALRRLPLMLRVVR